MKKFVNDNIHWIIIVLVFIAAYGFLKVNSLSSNLKDVDFTKLPKTKTTTEV
ncbi:MAG: hypothetical protein LBU51_01100 [Bacteroidales bacterium]|jgi:YbbR domain-containing protein|nr:hypothetical protein [Bacteroidales bacterium]